ncbi:hypothetical protein P7H12_00835 [Paenibacillus larvae]|nr:hypothetical protein [Paenibacillus larvae]MDT2262497.1 hypothetical protein [Paenibacillus larvae]
MEVNPAYTSGNMSCLCGEEQSERQRVRMFTCGFNAHRDRERLLS